MCCESILIIILTCESLQYITENVMYFKIKDIFTEGPTHHIEKFDDEICNSCNCQVHVGILPLHTDSDFKYQSSAVRVH